MLLLSKIGGVYHANIRFATGLNGERSLVIRTIQGYKDGLEQAKKITKKDVWLPSRKNFITFLIRGNRACRESRIHLAVSDEGFYTQTLLYGAR